MNPMMPPTGMPMQPPAPPQQPTPEQMEMLDKPSWEQVMGLLQDNVHRGYRIDIETDSTIAGSIESDMQGLSQIMGAVSTFMEQTQPLVQSGMLPIEAAKEILMTITRRARMGAAVEDALDKMTAPKGAQPDPSIQIAQMKQQGDAQKFQAQQLADQQKMQMQQQFEAQATQMKAEFDARAKQMDLQIEQQRMAMEAQAEQQRQQNEMVVEQHRQEMQAREVASQNQLEAQRAQQQAALDAQLEQMRIASDERMAAFTQQFDRWQAELEAATKIEVANIGSKAKMQDAATDAATGEISRDVT